MSRAARVEARTTIAVLQHYITRQAEIRPDATALVMGTERLAYGELEAASNQLARLLKEVGCVRGDRVCLLLPKAPRTIMGMVGVLKAGCAYVPIDAASPAARVEKILRSSEPRIILVDPSTRPLLDDLIALDGIEGARIGTLDDEPLEGERFSTEFSAVDRLACSTEPVEQTGSSGEAAHLLFTSGSTGVPKGVVITHENVLPFVEWAVEYFDMGSDDRNSGHTPLHFDLSTLDVFGTFATGAELHLVPPTVSAIPAKLAEFIRQSELTQWFSVPSVLTYLAKLDAIRKDDFPSLERVLWAGEVLPTPILIHCMQRLPHARFTNLYGPTEATISSSYHTLEAIPEDETAPIPIGTACPGEELLVLDGELEPVPAGEIGDLYIGGVGLSPGYWRDDEKTRGAFLDDPRNPGDRLYRTGDLARADDAGVFHFHGRADYQIKSRGYRIELGEVEVAINTLDVIRECAAVGVETEGFEGTSICCAYALDTDEDLEPGEFRDALRELLPSYMLPSRWLRFDELPKNVNGKIDRKRLKEIFEERRS